MIDVWVLIVGVAGALLGGFAGGWLCHRSILADEGRHTGKVHLGGRIYWRKPPQARRKLHVPTHGVPADYVIREWFGA